MPFASARIRNYEASAERYETGDAPSRSHLCRSLCVTCTKEGVQLDRKVETGRVLLVVQLGGSARACRRLRWVANRMQQPRGWENLTVFTSTSIIFDRTPLILSQVEDVVVADVIDSCCSRKITSIPRSNVNAMSLLEARGTNHS
jgi:hypothetical protein